MPEQQKIQTEQQAETPKGNSLKKGWAARWQALAGGDRKLILRLSAILVLGLVLMYAAGLWGGSGARDSAGTQLNPITTPGQEDTTGQTRINTSSAEEDLESKLLRILSAIAGAGQVDVALSYSESATAEYVVNSDTSTSTTDESNENGSQSTSNQESTSLSLAEINSSPVLVKEIMPQLCGAVIVAEGASDPAVKEQLHRAARILLGLPAHKIEVLVYAP